MPKVDSEKINKKVNKKRLTTTALRDSLDKTVLVSRVMTRMHPIYIKRFQIARKILVHTDLDVKKGQKVVIEETRPISKNKAWKVIEIK